MVPDDILVIYHLQGFLSFSLAEEPSVVEADFPPLDELEPVLPGFCPLQ